MPTLPRYRRKGDPIFDPPERPGLRPDPSYYYGPGGPVKKRLPGLGGREMSALEAYDAEQAEMARRAAYAHLIDQQRKPWERMVAQNRTELERDRSFLRNEQASSYKVPEEEKIVKEKTKTDRWGGLFLSRCQKIRNLIELKKFDEAITECDKGIEFGYDSRLVKFFIDYKTEALNSIKKKKEVDEQERKKIQNIINKIACNPDAKLSPDEEEVVFSTYLNVVTLSTLGSWAKLIEEACDHMIKETFNHNISAEETK